MSHFRVMARKYVHLISLVFDNILNYSIRFFQDLKDFEDLFRFCNYRHTKYLEKNPLLRLRIIYSNFELMMMAEMSF